MTVPGRGGRPRKWASDAERVRAFRARERGDEEPATVSERLENGGESAAAWAQAREFAETVSQQRVEIQALEREVKSTRRELAKQQARFGWLDGENQRLRAILQERANDVSGQYIVESTAGSMALPVVHSKEVPSAPNMNRAQRRQAERRSRRSS